MASSDVFGNRLGNTGDRLGERVWSGKDLASVYWREKVPCTEMRDSWEEATGAFCAEFARPLRCPSGWMQRRGPSVLGHTFETMRVEVIAWRGAEKRRVWADPTDSRRTVGQEGSRGERKEPAGERL